MRKKATRVETQPETTAIAVRVMSGIIKPQTLDEMIHMAELIAGSGMVPKHFENNPGAVLVAVQMGAELGLSPMGSIRNIAVINGRPSLWGDAGLALVRTHPDFIDIEERLDGAKAVCTLTRRGCSPVTSEFSWEDAKKAGLSGKAGPWSQYPKRMLQMRARWFAMRDLFPDALSGISSAEESQDIEIAAKPEWVEPSGKPQVGRHSFTRPKATEPAVFDAPTEAVAAEAPPPVPEDAKTATEKEVA